VLRRAALALASEASSQREQSRKDAAPAPRIASLRSAARPRAAKEAVSSPPPPSARARSSMRKSWPVDPSELQFRPERLFRRQPRLHFERARRLAV